MKRIIQIFLGTAAAMLLLASCEEFQPVFTGRYPAPEPWEIYTDEDFSGEFATISDLLDIYFNTDKVFAQYIEDKNNNGVVDDGELLEKEVAKTVGDGYSVPVTEDIVIRGVVTTTDYPGNLYKSLYIQDATGGIEIRIGKNGLYNDYKQGQILYVKCKGLYLGMYGYKSGKGNGTVSLGCRKDVDDLPKFENSAIEDTYLVNSHIFRGKMSEGADAEMAKPFPITAESMLPSSGEVHGRGEKGSLIGKMVKINGLKYADETFTLIYLDPNKDHESEVNRIFLSDNTWGIKTWAVNEERMKYHLINGDWDDCKVGGGNTDLGKVGEDKFKTQLLKNAMPASVSQYFTFAGTTVQIRTSGFCKFADEEIHSEVLSKAKTIEATGVLTLYQGSVQLTLISLDDVKVNLDR